LIGHEPVLLAEVIDYLKIRPDGVYVDATVGLGGHAAEIRKRLGPAGRLIGIDQDEEALRAARKRLGDERVTLLRGNFESLPALLDGAGVGAVDGILMDLGVSALQLKDPQRGFGFDSDADLDMRMDRQGATRASDLVNRLPEKRLADLIYALGDEHRSRRIARAIVRSRPHRSCAGLAEVIRRAVPRRGRIHPATKTFQALRIAVNRELELLPAALSAALDRLAPGGRLCVISYHSGEDRIVKDCFRGRRGPRLRVLTAKPLRPGPDERRRNPRSRSARMRVAERPATAGEETAESGKG